LTHRFAGFLSAARSHRLQNQAEQEREHEWDGKVWAHVAFFHVEIFEPRAHAMFRRFLKMKWRFGAVAEKLCGSSVNCRVSRHAKFRLQRGCGFSRCSKTLNAKTQSKISLRTEGNAHRRQRQCYERSYARIRCNWRIASRSRQRRYLGQTFALAKNRFVFSTEWIALVFDRNNRLCHVDFSCISQNFYAPIRLHSFSI
jgi:hypothetical protein